MPLNGRAQRYRRVAAVQHIYADRCTPRALALLIPAEDHGKPGPELFYFVPRSLVIVSAEPDGAKYNRCVYVAEWFCNQNDICELINPIE